MKELSWRARAKTLGPTSLLDDKSARLASPAKRLDNQERRLARLYRFGDIDDAFINREAQQLRRQKAGLEAELVSIRQQRLELESLDDVGDQVKGMCAQIASKLDGLSFDDKRLALKALQVKVVVGGSGVKLFGVIPQSYATIGQRLVPIKRGSKRVLSGL